MSKDNSVFEMWSTYLKYIDLTENDIFFSVHIIFDDAFELDESVDKYIPNGFVRLLYDCMEDAAR